MATIDAEILSDLVARGLLPPTQAAALAEAERRRPFSLHYELRALLYLGITLLSGGLGVLIYSNIDRLGHGVVIAVIAALMAACFGYAARHRAPFTWGVVPRTSIGADYLLLLGCLLFLVLEGYAQYQYGLFGTRYGLATALPAALFIALAYWFDHRGVLAMGLTALASWVGLSVAPLTVLQANDFGSATLRLAAVLLGTGLLAVGFGSELKGRKAHFAFTYLLLGANLALLALMATLVEATFSGGTRWAWGPPAALLVVALCAGLFWYARRTHSYWFLLLAAFYAYGVACYLFGLLALGLPGEMAILLGTLFFPASAVAIVLFFINMKKILRSADAAQSL